MKRAFLALAVSAFAFSPAARAADELKIGSAAGAPMENIFKPVKARFEKATGILLNAAPSGAKIAMNDVVSGAVEAAAAGLTFEDWLAFMKAEGAEVKDPSSLQSTVLGIDKIAVIVHKDNPVSKLSKEQIKDIFTGKVASWKDVGGSDAPIIVVWGKLIQGTTTTFVKKALDGEPPLKDVLEATTGDDVKLNVAANAEAIGIGPMGVADGSVKLLETPEVSRPITLVTKGKPSAKVQKLIDFVKGEGQEYIKK